MYVQSLLKMVFVLWFGLPVLLVFFTRSFVGVEFSLNLIFWYLVAFAISYNAYFLLLKKAQILTCNKFLSSDIRRLILLFAVFFLVLDLFYKLTQGRIVSSTVRDFNFIGYLIGVFQYGTISYILARPRPLRLVSLESVFFLMILLNSLVIGVRSAIVDVFFLLLFYASLGNRDLKIKKATVLLIPLTFLFYYIVAQKFRDGLDTLTFFDGFILRIWENIKVLNIGLEQPLKLKKLLFEDLGPSIFQQSLSVFYGEYSIIPTMYKVPMLWGTGPVIKPNGHYVGYTVGLAPFLFAIGYKYIIPLVIILRNVIKKSSKLFLMFAYPLYQFVYSMLWNFGLDAMTERLVKGFIYVIIFNLIVEVFRIVFNSGKFS